MRTASGDPSGRPASDAVHDTSSTHALSADEERRHLEQADQAIADAEERIAEQIERIAQLRADGHDVTEFEEVLATFRETLSQQRAYRATIVKVLTDLT